MAKIRFSKVKEYKDYQRSKYSYWGFWILLCINIASIILYLTTIK